MVILLLLLLLNEYRRRIKDTVQLKVTGVFRAERLQESLGDLADHELGTLLRQLHEAVLHYVIDQ